MSLKSYNIRFLTIELVSKSLIEYPTPVPDKIEFNFNFLVDIKLSADRKMAGVITDISISEIKEEEEQLKLGNFKTLCVFEIEEFDKVFTKKDDNTFDVPIDLEILLKSVGLSTTRGLIFSELRGTYLHGAVLPLIDMPGIVRKEREKLAIPK